MNINSPITELKGVGEKTKDLFAKAGVYTVGDILLRFPRSYVKYPDIIDIDELKDINTDEKYAIHACIRNKVINKKTKRMFVSLLDIGDYGHKIQLVWFRSPYIKNTIIPGKHYIFYGKISVRDDKYSMEQPEIYEVEKYSALEGTLQPVYSLSNGIKNTMMTKTIRSALAFDDLFGDYIPGTIRIENHYCEYNYAIKQIHFPDSIETLIKARERLVFDEFFLFIMGMQYQKEQQVKAPNNFEFKNPEFIDDLISKLPFSLTNAQLKTIKEIRNDMCSDFAMQRLVQGDVGSGKTIIAFLLMAWCSLNGYQSAIMAPTEVLATQHYETFTSLVRDFNLNYQVILLTGSMTAKQKRDAYEKMQLFPNAMIIGTHALIQEKAMYDNLALVITDEQHRFGVKQRDTFSQKGDSPHILVMSATPIPRTLAIIIYGDMDISVIDEVPAKRLPIKNCVVNSSYRPKAYEFMQNEINNGHQVYIICPLVEETENVEGENVVDYAKKLRELLPEDIKLGVLHGKMKNSLKNEVMEAFAANEIQILISTTVVEVGVNVPNATVMMIENADRFGLAQLHQLRGRVGRGDAQSYCIMINTSRSKTAQKRLDILNKSNDGFFIASEDLKLRGPGDFFGIRQSGDLAFQLGDIYQDAAILQKAADCVKEILSDDPDLESDQHKILKHHMDRFMENQLKKMNL